MSSNNVDNRVVNMQFNNEQFEAGVKQTLSSLEELKESLKFNTSLTGINAISNAISTFSIANISDQIETLTDRFSTLGIVGMTAIQNITNKVMNFATSKVTSTLNQITTGGWNRASSIAQSRFTLEGLFEGDMDKVTAAFDSASEAVDGTAYSLDSAVSAASQLAASGVEVGDEMTDTLKGIAGTAAMTGDSFDSIANIFTTVAGNGRLMGMQLTQLSSHGLNAAATIADYLGTTEAEVRDMVSDGEISFETFSNAMQSAFGDHAKDANKTFSGSMDNIKSALSRIGAIFSSGIIENDDLINTLNDVRKTIDSIKEAMLPLEDTFKNMVSSVAKLVSSLLLGLDLSDIETFVKYVGIGMGYVTDIADKWTEWNNKLKESVLGDVADDAEKVADAIHATETEITLAKEIWEQGLHGVGEARKEEMERLGQDYNTVQFLVNKLAAGVSDLTEVDVSSAKATEEAVNDVADATEKAAEQEERAAIPIVEILEAFQTFGEGIKIIFHNLETTVLTLGKTFKKVFSWKKFYTDIEDYGKLFTEFFSHFDLSQERAGKLERAMTGLWSAIDLARKAIKFLITAGVKILGPVLEVLFDIILDVSAAIGDAVTKFNEWSDEHSFLTDAVTWLGDTLSKTIETIRTFFTELWNLPAVQEIKDALLELGGIIIDTLAPYFDDAREAVEKFFDKLNGSTDDGSMTTTLDKINTALENMITFAGDAKTNLGDFFSWFGGGISDLIGFKNEANEASTNINKIKTSAESIAKSDSLGSLMTNLTSSVGGFGEKVDEVLSWAIKKFNSLDAAKVALIGVGSGLTAFGLSLSYLSFNLGNFVKSVTMVPTEIAGTIKSFKMVFKGMSTYLTNESQADVIKAIAIAIAVLAASLFILTKYTNVDDLERVITAMSMLMAVIAAIVIVITQVSKKMATNKEFFKSMASMALLFLAIAASALILAEALIELTSIKWTTDIIIPCIALIAILGLMVAISVALSKIEWTMSPAALNLIIFAAATWVLVKALKSLNTLDIEGLEDKMITLVAVLGTVGLVALLASGMSFGGGLGVLTIIASIWLIELALQKIIDDGVTMDDIQKNIKKFIPVLATLAIVATAMSIVGLACKDAKNMAINIIAVAAALYIITQSLYKLATVPFTRLVVATVALYVLCEEMVRILRAIASGGTYVNNAGKTILKVSFAIALLAGVAALLGMMKPEKLLVGLAAVTWLMFLMTILVYVSQYAKEIDYKALYAMVVAIGVLTLVIVLMSFIEDKMSVLESVGLLGLAMIAMGTSMYLASRWGNKINVKALIAMIVAIGVITASLMLLSGPQMDIPRLITATIAISWLMLSLGAALAVMNKAFGSKNFKTLGRLPVIVLMISMIGVIAASLYWVAKNDIKNTMMAAIAIMLVMGTVMGLMALVFSKMNKAKITGKELAAMIAMVVAIGVVAVSLSLILGTGAKWYEMLAAAGAMVLVIGLVSVAVGLLSKLASGAGMIPAIIILAGLSAILLSLSVAFKSFGVMVKTLVKSLQLLATIDLSNIDTAKLWQLVLIAAALSLVAVAAGAGLVAIGVGLVFVGIGAMTIVSAIALLAVTLAITSLAFTSFLEVLNQTLTIFSESNGKIKDGISEIGTGLANAIVGFITTLAVNAPIIASSISTIVTSIVGIIADGIVAINSKILECIVSLLTDIEENLPTITEKINSIITTILQSVASNAQTYGYYGAVIAISFLYGISEGLLEYSDELAQTVANVIIALFNMMSSLLDILLPSLTDGIKKGVLNLSEALWGVLAETGWDYAEENYQTVLGEQEQWEIDRAEKVGEVLDSSVATGIDNNSGEVSDATGEMLEDATDESEDTAKSSGSFLGGVFSSETGSSIESGFSGLDIEGTISKYTNIDLSGNGENMGSSLLSGFNSSVEQETVDVSNIPTSVQEQMKEQGWKYESEGSNIMVKMQDGVDDSTLDLTTNWDESETALYDEADDTADGMTEKGKTAGEYYGEGLIAGINNKINEIKEAYANATSEADESARSKAGLDEQSPSKKGIAAGEYYGIGLGNGILNMSNYVKNAAVGLASHAVNSVSDMMDTISTLVSDDSIDWTPTITPVVDSSQLQNGIGILGNVGANSLSMAADASVSVNNSSQNTLAMQVQALTEQVQKLADTDYSELLSGVNINVDASTNVDGTPLRRTASAFTIQQIEDQQRGLIMAAGGRM